MNYSIVSLSKYHRVNIYINLTERYRCKPYSANSTNDEIIVPKRQNLSCKSASLQTGETRWSQPPLPPTNNKTRATVPQLLFFNRCSLCEFLSNICMLFVMGMFQNIPYSTNNKILLELIMSYMLVYSILREADLYKHIACFRIPFSMSTCIMLSYYLTLPLNL